MHHLLTSTALLSLLAAPCLAHSPAEGLHVFPRQAAATSASASASRTAAASASRTSGAASATGGASAAGTGLTSSPLASLSLIGTATTSAPTYTLATTATAGQAGPFSGAPALPSFAALNPANYPALDKTPPIDSPQVKEWLSQIDLSGVPSIAANGANGCSNTTNSAAVANASASGNCWWTCGGCTRATDISYCPEKDVWGLSYDDGPSPYTPRILNLLNQQQIQGTFFLVGSRCISRPEMVAAEYISGHQLSVHTWSHPTLTQLSNEEIVAELGWTKQIIKDITGVTPNTMRPPYGDIDDRVRYIALQMGLTPVIWTAAQGGTFDTADWKESNGFGVKNGVGMRLTGGVVVQIGGGIVTATDAYNNFQNYLNNATQTLSTGFIVLAHDLYQQSVELAVDYILPQVISQGRLKLQTIAQCVGQSLSQAYIETSNTTDNSVATTTIAGSTGTGFVAGVSKSHTVSGATGTATPSSAAGSSGSGNTSGAAGANNQLVGVVLAMGAVAAGWALV